MKALWYLQKTTAKNRIKKALKKPVTYILLAVIVFYSIMIVAAAGGLNRFFGQQGEKGILTIVTVWCIYIGGGGYASLAKKKGVIFRNSHVHFLFPSPISPKWVLLSRTWMNFLLSFIVNVILALVGWLSFNISPGKVVLLFLASFLLEGILEGALIQILYGSDFFVRHSIRWMPLVVYTVMAMVAGGAFYVVYTSGLTPDSLSYIVESNWLVMIPIVGWNIALFRLILLPPTIFSLVGSCLYLVTVVFALYVAIRIKNQGLYYEDAATFAEDYEEYRNKKKSGEAVFRIGKQKKKYRKVRSHFNGGARAILSRHILEYKKEKFFIFDKNTVITILLAVLVGVGWKGLAKDHKEYLLLGVMAYTAFCAGGFKGKWDKELQSPYLYLIPDSPIKKMFYSTCMEYVRGLVEGSVMAIILGSVWKVPPLLLLLSIIIYLLLQACKIHLKVIAQLLVGNTYGKAGKDFVRFIIQSIPLLIGVVIGIGAGISFSSTVAFGILIIYSLLAALVTAFLASIKFSAVEM